MGRGTFFIPREVPRGDAPEELRQAWVGVPIAITERWEGYPGALEGAFTGQEFDTPDGAPMVGTNGELALHALRSFDREEAADRWEEQLDQRVAEIRAAFGYSALTTEKYPLHFVVEPGDDVLSGLDVLLGFQELTGDLRTGQEYIQSIFVRPV